MIIKNKKCIECGREDLPHFSRKRCIYCAKKSYTTNKKTPKIVDKSNLDSYYDKKIKESKTHPYSFESGLFISNLSRKNICHLLPKRTYKSVEDNEDNFVLLTFEEHSKFDHLLDKFRFGQLQEEFPKTFNRLIQFVNDYKLILEHKKLKEEILNRFTINKTV